MVKKCLSCKYHETGNGHECFCMYICYTGKRRNAKADLILGCEKYEPQGKVFKVNKTYICGKQHRLTQEEIETIRKRKRMEYLFDKYSRETNGYKYE